MQTKRIVYWTRSEINDEWWLVVSDTDSITLIAFDMGGVLALYDERIPSRELMQLSGKSESQVFNACFSTEKKRPLETGVQSWPDFVNESNSILELDLADSEFKKIFDSSHYSPNRDIFDLVEQLSTRYRLGVCSNTGPTHWELQRDRLPFFDVFVRFCQNSAQGAE